MTSVQNHVVSKENLRIPRFTPKVSLRIFSGKHVKPLFCKCMWSNSGMLEGIEPVKIFHQFLFLAAIQFNNITCRKLFGVIFNSFVYISCLHSIQFCNISVKNNLNIPDDYDFYFLFLLYLLDVPYFYLLG